MSKEYSAGEEKELLFRIRNDLFDRKMVRFDLSMRFFTSLICFVLCNHLFHCEKVLGTSVLTPPCNVNPITLRA